MALIRRTVRPATVPDAVDDVMPIESIVHELLLMGEIAARLPVDDLAYAAHHVTINGWLDLWEDTRRVLADG